MIQQQPKREQQRETIKTVTPDGKTKRHRVRLKQQNKQPEVSEQPAGIMRMKGTPNSLLLFGRFLFAGKKKKSLPRRGRSGAGDYYSL